VAGPSSYWNGLAYLERAGLPKYMPRLPKIRQTIPMGLHRYQTADSVLTKCRHSLLGVMGVQGLHGRALNGSKRGRRVYTC
jgi:hypothetical protein